LSNGENQNGKKIVIKYDNYFQQAKDDIIKKLTEK